MVPFDVPPDGLFRFRVQEPGPQGEYPVPSEQGCLEVLVCTAAQSADRGIPVCAREIASPTPDVHFQTTSTRGASVLYLFPGEYSVRVGDAEATATLGAGIVTRVTIDLRALGELAVRPKAPEPRIRRRGESEWRESRQYRVEFQDSWRFIGLLAGEYEVGVGLDEIVGEIAVAAGEQQAIRHQAAAGRLHVTVRSPRGAEPAPGAVIEITLVGESEGASFRAKPCVRYLRLGEGGMAATDFEGLRPGRYRVEAQASLSTGDLRGTAQADVAADAETLLLTLSRVVGAR